MRAAREAVGSATRTAAHLANLLGCPHPADPSDAEQLCRWTSWALAAPDLRGFRLDSDAWRVHRDAIRTLLGSGHSLRQWHQQYAATLLPEAWDQDVGETRRDLAEYGPKWWRAFSGNYRRARSRIRELSREVPPSPEAELALADAILEVQRLRGILRVNDAFGTSLFGPRWSGEASDWAALGNAFDWLAHLHTEADAGRLPPGLVEPLARAPHLVGLDATIEAAAKALAEQRRTVRELIAALELDEAVRFGAGARLADQPFAAQEATLLEWERCIDDLQGITALNNTIAACHNEGLGAVVEAALPWPQAGEQLVEAFEYFWHEAVLRQAYRERPSLAHFDGEDHELAIGQFRRLDRITLEYNRARLAAQHWTGVPQGDGAGQLAVLRREFEKKSRHLPARRLLAQAGNAIQAIKPVFMMSPLSIATFLAPGSATFDLIIFDEASQVRPVDAFGAILRGRQVVVVGDSQQLPPTSFFDTLISEDEVDDENFTSDIESILGLFKSQGTCERMLRWHYRSRHESLIAVSNHLFYNDRLVIFPSPDAERREAGLIFHHLPHTAYDRSRTRTNPQEAASVARAVMEHARHRPDLSLGVAAFSTAQMKAIQDQLELLRRQDGSYESFFAAHPHEPFFVKNLETVQGDERDVIFISVGYGRTSEGYLAETFGPLTGKHGGRRLNVLITRARIRCEVFSNLIADDIRSETPGVRALKAFLTYAQTGRLDVPIATRRDFDSPFEIAVSDALSAAGYVVEKQIGSGGFFIDLAIVDPERPGRYLLGIECDGAMYHSARSARERDRLRQQVLEDLGWRIHRVWSTDWFRNPDKETRRLIAAIEMARVYAPPRVDEASSPPTPPERDVPVPRGAAEVEAVAVPPYTLARVTPLVTDVELHLVPQRELASRVAEVVSAEGPVHTDEVMRRIREAAGVRRIGGRIDSALQAAIAQAARTGTIRQEGDFLWPTAMQQPPLRDRIGLPAASRRLDLVAPEEIALAIERVVDQSYGIAPDDIPPLACRLLGFQRTTDDMRARVQLILDTLLQTGRLTSQGNQIIIGNEANA
jgi:very-short-patch-repair endonuclease